MYDNAKRNNKEKNERFIYVLKIFYTYFCIFMFRTYIFIFVYIPYVLYVYFSISIRLIRESTIKGLIRKNKKKINEQKIDK